MSFTRAQRLDRASEQTRPPISGENDKAATWPSVNVGGRRQHRLSALTPNMKTLLRNPDPGLRRGTGGKKKNVVRAIDRLILLIV